MPQKPIYRLSSKDKIKKTNKLRRFPLIVMPIFAVVAALSGCEKLPLPTPELTADQVFEPNPGVIAESSGLTITVQGLGEKRVCSGAGASLSDDGQTCSVGTEVLDSQIALNSCEAQGVTISYIGNNGKQVSVSGNFDTGSFGDCDSDTDTVSNNLDNCPDIANVNQNDLDGDLIGDACDDNIDGDAFANAPEDQCEYIADDNNTCSVDASNDLDSDGVPDTAIDNCVGVFNPNQQDSDGDGIGNHCDATPIAPTQAWANHGLLMDWNEWEGDIRCLLNNKRNGNSSCTDPSGATGSSISCPNGGTAVWDISISGFGGNTVFTYTDCSHTLDGGETLIVNGRYTGWFNISANSDDATGTFTISGDWSGLIQDRVNIVSSSKASGYYDISCTVDPLGDESCRSGNQTVRFNAPSPFACDGDICPQAGTSLVDTDGDGVFDGDDNCIDAVNADQANIDYDALGDACDDSNDAGAVDDDDADGIINGLDNCPAVANGPDLGPNDQLDSDGDLAGDVCDATPQGDNDSIDFVDDNCVFIDNEDQANIHGDAADSVAGYQGDACEDQDADGIMDAIDTCPLDANNLCALGNWYTVRNTSRDKCLQHDPATDLVDLSACDADNMNQRFALTAAGSNWKMNLATDNNQCLGNFNDNMKVSACSDDSWFQYAIASDSSGAWLDVAGVSGSGDQGCLYALSSDVHYYWNCGLWTEIYWDFRLEGAGDMVSASSLKVQF